MDDKWSTRLAILLVLAVLFWNPFTRQIILFILPLGGGIDDLIFIVVLVAVVVVWLIRRAVQLRKRMTRDAMTVFDVVMSFMGLQGIRKKLQREIERSRE